VEMAENQYYFVGRKGEQKNEHSPVFKLLSPKKVGK
jgi:hypothetical protein